MSSVQIRILAGPLKGTRLRVEKNAVTFGRAPECDLTIDQPFISRMHGRLVQTDAGWALENHSANGTLVAGKKITKKPRPIHSGQVVAIGDQDVFEIIALSEPEAPATAEPPAKDTPSKPKLSGRAKLWIGIGAYMALMLVLIMIFSLIRTEEEIETSPIDRLGPLSESDIRLMVQEEIRAPLPKQPPDSRKVVEHSEIALEAYNARASRDGETYRAVMHYRIALSHTREPRLPDPEDDRRRIEAQEQLIDEITELYSDAYNLLRNHTLDRADDRYRALSRLYPAPGTPLSRRFEREWALARAALKKRR